MHMYRAIKLAAPDTGLAMARNELGIGGPVDVRQSFGQRLVIHRRTAYEVLSFHTESEHVLQY